MATKALVIVTFNPSMSVFDKTYREVSREAEIVCVVDNGSPAPTQEALKRITSSDSTTTLILSRMNRGIGWAQNVGVSAVAARGASQVMFLDQDTRMPPGAIGALFAVSSRLRSVRLRPAAVGPALRSVEYVKGSSRALTPTPFVASSGSVVEMSTMRAVGGFREDYFIDHVDKEWGLRAYALGYKSYCANWIQVDHELGDREGIALGKVRRYHSDPSRDYYLVRNELLLWKDLGTRSGELVLAANRLIKWCLVTLIAGDVQLPRFIEMVRGLLDGARGIAGSRGAPLTERIPVPKFPARPEESVNRVE